RRCAAKSSRSAFAQLEAKHAVFANREIEPGGAAGEELIDQRRPPRGVLHGLQESPHHCEIAFAALARGRAGLRRRQTLDERFATNRFELKDDAATAGEAERAVSVLLDRVLSTVV